MLDIFWNKICKDAGVTTKKEILEMEGQIKKLEKEISNRKELIELFEKDPTTLNKKHIDRHIIGIKKAEMKIAEIQKEIKNCKKEFDK
ncbi:MAG: hypothetical protein GOVbin1807_70 [Prokaryotic dsDNA virus sp.]|nr:MAG: hypothetical protein GOVbin1807_70 [Prokaryotic dsDNA virus sp.]|tara:strand:- start:247 stop:510 length:264 start_codon:yes stop_codon:yes gene_type:complete